MIMKEIIFYQHPNNKAPVVEWLKTLDKPFRIRIQDRLTRIEQDDNFGDFKKIDSELSELRFNYGSGYRIYYSEINLENLPSYKECLLLAQNIKEKLKFKNIYSIEPIKKYYYVPHASKLTGFTETIDGNFSANYTDNSGSERIIGYKLLTHATENNSYYNEKKAIESWKKKES